MRDFERFIGNVRPAHVDEEGVDVRSWDDGINDRYVSWVVTKRKIYKYVKDTRRRLTLCHDRNQTLDVGRPGASLG